MKKNTVPYRGKRSSRRLLGAKLVLVGAFLFISASVSYAQRPESSEIVLSMKSFLSEWLIKRNVDTALKFLSDDPVFPSCITDKGLGETKWGSSRASVVGKLRGQLGAIFEEKKFKSLSEILERPTTVLYSEEKPQHQDFPRLDAGDLASILDIYPVSDEMRQKLLSYRCVQDRDTRRYVQGINENKELFLVLTDSKRVDAGLTFLWTRENGKLRILTIDLRLP